MEPARKVVPHFQDELDVLKRRLLLMGGEAEEQLRGAIRSLVARNFDLARDIQQSDAAINRLHLEIDERCFKLLALHQPMASNLRFIVAGVKINGELERIGDIAVNIAEATLRYIRHPEVKPLIDIPKMGNLAQGMLRDALNAYVRLDAALARDVLKRDDELDALKDQVFMDLLDVMVAESSKTEPSLELIMISRHLERVGDHATNIAEDVIFIESGHDVRHHSAD